MCVKWPLGSYCLDRLQAGQAELTVGERGDWAEVKSSALDG